VVYIIKDVKYEVAIYYILQIESLGVNEIKRFVSFLQ